MTKVLTVVPELDEELLDEELLEDELLEEELELLDELELLELEDDELLLEDEELVPVPESSLLPQAAKAKSATTGTRIFISHQGIGLLLWCWVVKTHQGCPTAVYYNQCTL